MKKLSLSKHFTRRWRQYFDGQVPSSREVARIIGESKIIDIGQMLRKGNGDEYKLLSTFCHFGWGCVIKVDWEKDPPEAVTLITEKSRRE